MSNEIPKDKPHEGAGASNKQTDQPWKGVPEKEQFDPKRKKPDLEKWKDTNTH
ncbi:hypothetical protein [Tardiphaga sp. 42S5]|uniref:hypothetical protein n=1 Tax=Tardiphaga sp. 42S5 TaxID=1404799 RepID=UPI002A59BA99|nr:hypothetical protein [Tardiphaga sp. 42S5]WPO43323.1 hypothetical protein SFY93_09340 [Tardiphaga sp. 42S5]